MRILCHYTGERVDVTRSIDNTYIAATEVNPFLGTFYSKEAVLTLVVRALYPKAAVFTR